MRPQLIDYNTFQRLQLHKAQMQYAGTPKPYNRYITISIVVVLGVCCYILYVKYKNKYNYSGKYDAIHQLRNNVHYYLNLNKMQAMERIKRQKMQELVTQRQKINHAIAQKNAYFNNLVGQHRSNQNSGMFNEYRSLQ
jgi:hypothetical protein